MEAWELWHALSVLHAQRRTPLDAQEIQAVLDVFAVTDPTRRIELFRLIAGMEATYLDYRPEDAEGDD
jgi:hypothetical protein